MPEISCVRQGDQKGQQAVTCTNAKFIFRLTNSDMYSDNMQLSAQSRF